MAVVTEGWRAELLYQVEDEVLGTTFYWKVPSNPNLLGGTRRLAEALEQEIPQISDAFGSNVKFHGWKCKGISVNPRWSYQIQTVRTGTAVTAAEDELLHFRLNLLSEDVGGNVVKRNRNQISGLPNGDVTNGRVSVDISSAWFSAIDRWATGGVQSGGFQFFLAVGFKTETGFFFADVESWSASPFVGTRRDRIKNRPTPRGCTAPQQPASPPE